MTAVRQLVCSQLLCWLCSYCALNASSPISWSNLTVPLNFSLYAPLKRERSSLVYVIQCRGVLEVSVLVNTSKGFRSLGANGFIKVTLFIRKRLKKGCHATVLLSVLPAAEAMACSSTLPLCDPMRQIAYLCKR